MLALFGLGCASPGERFLADAAGRGFVRGTFAAPHHELVVLRHGSAHAGEPLHIYLDGDGSPWISPRRIAQDPTSRERLVLALMQRDPAAAVLIGRPCYYGAEGACDASMWTSRRYSEAVVAAMAAAIDAEIAAGDPGPVTLIGYSGGGALAMLIAPRIDRVERVVTLAANLDVGAWTAHHGHSPLARSLDPALAPALPARIAQRHLFGADDENVPAERMRHVAERQASAEVVVVEGFDHACCWAAAWPELMHATPDAAHPAWRPDVAERP